MNNIFFDGKLPSFFGFDRSNIEIPGNRATVSQGAVYKAHGRTTSFCPSWRFVVSLESNECQAHLPGGLSDRRFSKNYQSDISNWENFHYRHYQLENWCRSWTFNTKFHNFSLGRKYENYHHNTVNTINQCITNQKLKYTPWTDDYWASYKGGISYRWNDFRYDWLATSKNLNSFTSKV